MPGWIIAVAAVGYISILFAVAYFSDRRAAQQRSLSRNPYIYALSLAVYCSAWTFYGSVGRAANTGIGFLPIYLGPTLTAGLWWFVLRKMVRISKANRLTSIADFIASRYGKSGLLGGLVTVVAVVGIVPYISLQLKAIATSFNVLWHYPALSVGEYLPQSPILSDTAFYVAVLMALFSILFGTRHLDNTEHHEGLIVAVAFESVVKLAAFIAVGLFVTFGMFGGLTDLFSRVAAKPALQQLLTSTNNYADWTWLIALSMMAILLLPRQFHLAVTENTAEEHLAKASWLFPLYLFGINLFVLPIAMGGLLHFSAGQADPDFFVLLLPLAAGQQLLALLAFIGGLSAASSMVIVSTVALTTMVSNALVMPALLRWPGTRLADRSDLSGLILGIRRGAIIIIILLSYGYFRATSTSLTLVSIGLISFTAVAQFAPALLGGMYWKRGTLAGALAGISVGFVIWGYTLMLPSLAESGWLSAEFVEYGLFGSAYFKPYALFGLPGLNPVSHALIWSLLFNVGLYLVVSLLSNPRAIEQGQAVRFVDVFSLTTTGERTRFWRGSASVSALRALLNRFIGDRAGQTVLTEYATQKAIDLETLHNADAELVDFVETQLGGVIGSASARAVVAATVQKTPLGTDEVLAMAQETSDLRAANAKLRELDRLKDDFVSTVTHELRTPLTAIRASAEILRDYPLDDTQRQTFAGVMVSESERLTRLINNVLDLSRIETGNVEWVITEVDMVAVVRAVVDSTAHLVSDKGIALQLEIPAKVPPVPIDHDRMVQVLLNLVSNAIKFCPPKGGKITIGLHVRPQTLRVDVADNGPGIDPQDYEIVFSKFQQVGDTLTSKPQGTGLGLPISRHIVTHFGGELWIVANTEPGATFAFTIPRPATGDQYG